MQLDLTPFIHSHYIQGVPAQELTDNTFAKKRLQDLFSLYDMYCENPCMDVKKALQHKFRHSERIIDEDLMYFDYIRKTFTRMTRQKALDLVNWAGEKSMRDAAAVNDRKGMLDAAKVILKANQLDKPEPEQEDKILRPMSYVFTPFVEVLDPDRRTIRDPKLLKMMNQWGAHIDAQDERIQQKVIAMQEATVPDGSPVVIKSNRTPPDASPVGNNSITPCQDKE